MMELSAQIGRDVETARDVFAAMVESETPMAGEN
jgi:hypothetical protein